MAGITHLTGIEPAHTAPEAIALSTELQVHYWNITLHKGKKQMSFVDLGMLIC